MGNSIVLNSHRQDLTLLLLRDICNTHISTYKSVCGLRPSFRLWKTSPSSIVCRLHGYGHMILQPPIPSFPLSCGSDLFLGTSALS